jgi:lipopolysaccharide/colanic/teichoic acid biosynthesis glycosyltransferase
VFENKFIKSKTHLISDLRTIYYYIYYRAFSKIPIINKIHLLLSNGSNRVISKAEVWGRLFFNGFDIKKQNLFDGLSFLLVRKELTPSENPNPSFYPIITLDRIGLYGNIIKIHKVRSMYPYSEFLQKKLFEENSISSIGKFGNDFRITRLGKFYRKYWIDELPQIIDWFRGEIKLVGIRALSQHFFSLYSSEYQKFFIQVKPGIISPLFDENTDGFADIERIELKYLKSYLSHPVITDIKYFFITFKQIISGVRSK